MLHYWCHHLRAECSDMKLFDIQITATWNILGSSVQVKFKELPDCSGNGLCHWGDQQESPYFTQCVSWIWYIYNVLYNEWWILDRCITWLSGPKKYVPNYTCRREMKSIAVLTGISWIISTNIGALLELYKYPQVRTSEVEKDKTAYNSLPFPGAKRGWNKSVLMDLTKFIIPKSKYWVMYSGQRQGIGWS